MYMCLCFIRQKLTSNCVSDHGRALQKNHASELKTTPSWLKTFWADVTLLSGSLGLSWHASRLPAPGADLSFSSLFITLDMHQWTWLSWLGIILQRNEFSLRVFVGYQNTPQYNMPATGGLLMTHHHTPNWSEIFPGPLKPSRISHLCTHFWHYLLFHVQL